MRHTAEFLKLGIKKPKECHVCGYGISFTMPDDYIRTEKYIHDCPWCDMMAQKENIIPPTKHLILPDIPLRHC